MCCLKNSIRQGQTLCPSSSLSPACGHVALQMVRVMQSSTSPGSGCELLFARCLEGQIFARVLPVGCAERCASHSAEFLCTADRLSSEQRAPFLLETCPQKTL